MNHLLSPNCVYTIRHSQALEAACASGGTDEFIEGRWWKTGSQLFRDAQNSKRRMPVLFAPADSTDGLTHWALIDEIEPSSNGTAVKISELRQLPAKKPLHSLKKLNTGESLSDDYIRPYVLCKTPAFLSALAKTKPRPSKRPGDYIAYHRTELMGEFQPGNSHSWLSRKPRPVLECAIGARVWMISGSRDNRRRMVYRLHGKFTPSEIRAVRKQRDLRRIVGEQGMILQPPRILNDLHWFKDLLRTQNNFSLGFQPVHEEAILAGLNSEMSTGSAPVLDQASDIEDVPADRALTTIKRIIRDTELSRQVKAMHNFECQICGHTIPLRNGLRYAEAHHVQPLGCLHNGPDTIANILCVCPNHHAELDYGVIPLSLSTLHQLDAHAIDLKYIDYHNRKIYMLTDLLTASHSK